MTRTEERKKHAAYQRRWAKANPDKKRANDGAYRAKNRERMKDYFRARYQVKRQEIRLQQKAYRDANRSAINSARRTHRKENGDEIRSADRARWSATREQRKETRRQYRLNNPEKVRTYARRSYTRHRAKMLEKHREYYLSHRDGLLEYARRYAQENPGKCRAHGLAYLARRVAASFGDKKQLAAFYEWAQTARRVRCYWCGVMTSPKARHVDHVVPLKRKGPHSVGNLCISCPTCNHQKNAKAPEEFSGQGEFILA